VTMEAEHDYIGNVANTNWQRGDALKGLAGRPVGHHGASPSGHRRAPVLS
jgi:hypothetical protein